MTPHSYFRDGNTESQDIKKLGQMHTFDSNPGPQALESPPSPRSRPSKCFRSNPTLKAHAHFVKCHLLSPFWKLRISKHTAEFVHTVFPWTGQALLGA